MSGFYAATQFEWAVLVWSRDFVSSHRDEGSVADLVLYFHALVKYFASKAAKWGSFVQNITTIAGRTPKGVSHQEINGQLDTHHSIPVTESWHSINSRFISFCVCNLYSTYNDRFNWLCPNVECERTEEFRPVRQVFFGNRWRTFRRVSHLFFLALTQHTYHFPCWIYYTITFYVIGLQLSSHPCEEDGRVKSLLESDREKTPLSMS